MPNVVVDGLVTKDRDGLAEEHLEDGAGGDGVHNRPLLGREVEDGDRLAGGDDCAAERVRRADVCSVLQALCEGNHVNNPRTHKHFRDVIISNSPSSRERRQPRYQSADEMQPATMRRGDPWASPWSCRGERSTGA